MRSPRTLTRTTAGEEEITKRFVKILKDIGYCGRIVLEGDPRPDFETSMHQFSEQFPLFD